jgi:hypothetical protein
VDAAVLIRGLHEAWTRNPNNWSLQTLIHSYGDVQVGFCFLLVETNTLTTWLQYNALLDLAATGNTYSSNWHGPPQGFTTWGQLAALDVLTANIEQN